MRSAPSLLYAGLAIVLLLLVATAFAVPGPIIFADEQIYLKLAQGLIDGHPFMLRGVRFPLPTVLYPILIAPMQLAGDTHVAYRLIQGLNALVFTAAGVPIYLIARRFLAPAFAAGLAVLALVFPCALYAHLAMTESLFFLLLMTFTALALSAIVDGSPAARLGLAMVMGLAFFTKPQGMLLPLVAAVALVVAWWARRGTGRLRLKAWWPAIALYAGFVALHGLRMRALTGDADHMLGVYSGGLRALRPLSVVELVKTLAALVSAQALAIGFVPVVLFAAYAWWARRQGAGDRVFVALVLMLGVVLYGLSARQTVLLAPLELIYERYTFYLGPLVLVGALRFALAVRWRPWPIAVAAGACALLAGAFVFRSSGTPTAIDAPTYSIFWSLADGFGWGWWMARALGVAGGLGFVAVAVPILHAKRWRLGFAAFIAYGLAVTALALWPQAALSQSYAASRPRIEWVLAHARSDRPLAVLVDYQPPTASKLLEIYARMPFRMYYIDNPVDRGLDRRIVPEADGTLGALSDLPEGSRIVASERVPLALPVLARKDDMVVYDKRGPVRLAPTKK